MCVVTISGALVAETLGLSPALAFNFGFIVHALCQLFITMCDV